MIDRKSSSAPKTERGFYEPTMFPIRTFFSILASLLKKAPVQEHFP